MALREGSSDEVIRDNIRCLLEKDGCGHDPPYKDKARDSYTPAQAAAIAYAKAGKRKNKQQSLKKEKEAKASIANASEHNFSVPEGWKVDEKR